MTGNPCSDKLDDMKRKVTEHLHNRWSDMVSDDVAMPRYTAMSAAYFIVQLSAGLV